MHMQGCGKTMTCTLEVMLWAMAHMHASLREHDRMTPHRHAECSKHAGTAAGCQRVMHAPAKAEVIQHAEGAHCDSCWW